MKRKNALGKAVLAACIMACCMGMMQIGNPLQAAAQQISLLGKYDSADTAAIKKIDTQAGTISFRNHDTGRDYTLSYDNTTLIYSQYGRSLSPKLLEAGTVADITFLKSSRHLNSLVISSAAWTQEDTTDYSFSDDGETATFEGTNYHIGPASLVLTEGEPAILADILQGDTVRASGVGQEVYSICVTHGHGYVSLSSDSVSGQSLAGAWLELGNTVIHRVTDNMLVNAPEGEYELHILGNGADYTKTITVARNRETVIDVSDIPVEAPEEGEVTFETDPADAKVYVDGQEVLTGIPLTYEYGFHKLSATADGYKAFDKYLRVGQASAVVQLTLEKESEVSGNSSSASSAVSAQSASAAKASTASAQSTTASSAKKGNVYTVSGNSTGSTSEVTDSSSSGSEITGYKVYVDAPTDAELYLDGNYIGIVPSSFTKVSGTHTVTLRRSGYTTRSYSISIDSSKCDRTYSFPDLIRETTVSENATE